MTHNCFDASFWNPVRTGISFTCSNAGMQDLHSRALAACAANTVTYNGRVYLREGGGYRNIWPETQPMGGADYAVVDPVPGLNNCLVFMQYQRRDGRIPGMLFNDPARGLCAAYDWFQGFCFPEPALQMYWYIHENSDYLKLLYNALKDFDAYLWKYRDSTGSGCLERWCCWDTGEDNLSVLLENGGKDGCFGGEEPPDQTAGPMPWKSSEIMAYSFSARSTLAKISRLLNNGEADSWSEKASEVRKAVREQLWDEVAGACFDRYADGSRIDCLSHVNLRCMYYGLFSQDMADIFVRKHLMNPDEFFTPVPIPSIAVNNRWFRNLRDNNWSGPSQGLTMQRAVRALTNYGYEKELLRLARPWLDAVNASGDFYQQYDPFTGEPGLCKSGYGPTALAVLDLLSLMYGIHVENDRLAFSSVPDGSTGEFTQRLGEDVYRWVREKSGCKAYKNGSLLFSAGHGSKVTTDRGGNILKSVPII